MVPNTLLGGYIFHVHNYGHNTVPAGMPIEARSGFVRVNVNLTHPLGPDETQDFGAPANELSHPMTNHDACEAGAYPPDH